MGTLGCLDDSMSNYSFRIRFTKSPRDTINIDLPSWDTTLPNSNTPISLRSTKRDTSIREDKNLTLHGHGWNSEEEAKLAGEECQDALMLSLVRLRIGADFGNRAPKSAFTQAGLTMLEQQTSQRMLNDFHGLMVYKREPVPLFASLNAGMVRGVQQEKFEEVFRYAILNPRQLTDRERLSIECFNSSFFQTTEDTRFLLLMMAIEALLEPAQRPTASQRHVEQLIDQTRKSKLLTNTEIDSLLGSLRWLLQESIGQSGRRLASERLGNRTYLDRSPASFFTFCYSIRSCLVHGQTPFPSRDEVSSVVAALEVFVSELLSGSLLEVGD